jgi:hypothetical protein
MVKQNIKVKKSEDNPESTELLAANIIKVAEGFEKLLKSPLNDRALIVLLHDAIGQGNISKGQIRLVLDALPRLKGWYIKK